MNADRQQGAPPWPRQHKTRVGPCIHVHIVAAAAIQLSIHVAASSAIQAPATEQTQDIPKGDDA